MVMVRSAMSTLIVLSLSVLSARAQTAPALDLLSLQQGLRQLEAEQKLEAAQEYYRSGRGLADGLELVATYGYTDRTSGYAEPGSHYPADFEGTLGNEKLYGAELGFFDKKIARDVCITASTGCLERYIEHEDGALRWLVLDALRLDARAGYGHRLEARGTDVDEFFYVGLKWRVPLSGPQRNPLDPR